MATFMDVHTGFFGVTQEQLATCPTREAVMRIHERAGHPTAEVYQLTIEV